MWDPSYREEAVARCVAADTMNRLAGEALVTWAGHEISSSVLTPGCVQADVGSLLNGWTLHQLVGFEVADELIKLSRSQSRIDTDENLGGIDSPTGLEWLRDALAVEIPRRFKLDFVRFATCLVEECDGDYSIRFTYPALQVH